MRLKLILRSTGETLIPINYNYPLSGAIYRLLGFGSPEFASFLHNKGYRIDGKSYKLFSFALKPEKCKAERDMLRLLSPVVDLYITTPLDNDFVNFLLTGLYHSKELVISQNRSKTTFSINSLESIPAPDFCNDMSFDLLSPLVLSTKTEHNGKLHQYFLRYNETDEINRILNLNLINKYSLLHGHTYNGEGVSLYWDKTYIDNKIKRGLRISKKVTITRDSDNPIDIIGIQAPFNLKGDPELIKTGYLCGFGERNSMGFGFAVHHIV